MPKSGMKVALWISKHNFELLQHNVHTTLLYNPKLLPFKQKDFILLEEGFTANVFKVLVQEYYMQDLKEILS